MNKYFIEKEGMKYCYPNEVSKKVTEYGVLSEYIGKMYSREEIDKIIAEMIVKHPYIENSMYIKLNVLCKEKGRISYYHMLFFKNDNYKNEEKGNLEIKYEM